MILYIRLNLCEIHRGVKKMAHIKPFKGYRYNIEKIEDMSKVVAPLKYNISDEERELRYESEEHNIVKIFDGKSFDADTESSNKYTRAAEYLKKWIEDGVIVQDDEEAIYLYEETTVVNGNTYRNTTFVGLLELEELGTGNIKTCEEVHEISQQDRYDVLAATQADLSMISCLYVERDKKLLNIMNVLTESKPDMEFVTDDGLVQRLWMITDTPTIEEICEGFKELPLYITDGQTRYATCMQYRNYMRANNPLHTGEEPYNYTMVSLFNSNSDGVVILPEHRMIKLPRGFSEEFFIAMVQDHFKIEKIIVDSQDESITETMKTQIRTKKIETKLALYNDGEYFYRLTLIDPDYIKKELLPQMSKAYCSLDTVVLRKLVINDIFGIEEDYDDLVSTSISARHCMDCIKDGKADAMVVMNPVKVEQIESVTAAGETMPFRTISVFPKPNVGVIINLKN